MNAEHIRLDEAREQKAPWKKWGPYLSERQWGTVREDYSEGGNFHGDNGAGLGASHQTGWTGIVARGIHLFGTTKAEQMLHFGKRAVVAEAARDGQLAARV
jgi:hypothetical protein